MPGDLEPSLYNHDVQESGHPSESLRSRSLSLSHSTLSLSPGMDRHGNGAMEQARPSERDSLKSGGVDHHSLEQQSRAFNDFTESTSDEPSFKHGVDFGFLNGLVRFFEVPDELLAEFRKSTFDEQLRRLFPVFAVLQWWFFNVFLVLLNKWIFQMYQFNFPLTLTAIHFLISFFGAFLCIRVFHLKPLAKVTTLDLIRRILPMALVTNLNVCLGNVSLRYIPVTFMQVVKAFTPATTVALQAFIQKKEFDLRVHIALIPVVGGVTLASATELSFHAVGFIAAFTSTVFTSANSIMAEVLLKGHIEMDSINMVYYMAPQIVLMLTPLAIFSEWEGVAKWYAMEGNRFVEYSVIIFSGVLAFGLNFSLFFAIQATSAMTFNVAGNLKVAVAMLLGWLIYQNPMSSFSTLGCAVTVVGCTWYGYIQHKVKLEQKQQEERQKYRSLSNLDVALEKGFLSESKNGQVLINLEVEDEKLLMGNKVPELHKN